MFEAEAMVLKDMASYQANQEAVRVAKAEAAAARARWDVALAQGQACQQLEETASSTSRSDAFAARMAARRRNSDDANS
jgi:hypothetical protein